MLADVSAQLSTVWWRGLFTSVRFYPSVHFHRLSYSKMSEECGCDKSCKSYIQLPGQTAARPDIRKHLKLHIGTTIEIVESSYSRLGKRHAIVDEFVAHLTDVLGVIALDTKKGGASLRG